jgi:hypothetical protein
MYHDAEQHLQVRIAALRGVHVAAAGNEQAQRAWARGLGRSPARGAGQHDSPQSQLFHHAEQPHLQVRIAALRGVHVAAGGDEQVQRRGACGLERGRAR